MITSVLLPGVAAALLLAAAMTVHGAFGWIAAAPLCSACLAARRWRHAAAAGALFGMVLGCAVHADWLAETARLYFRADAGTAWAAAIGLALLTGASQGTALGLALRAAGALPGLLALLAGGAAWAAWEWLGLHVFPDYPWAALALGSARAAVAAMTTPAAYEALVLGAVSAVGQVGVTWMMATTGLALGGALARTTAVHRGAAFVLALACPMLVAILGSAARAPADLDGDLCSIEAIDAAVRAPAGSMEAYLAATQQRATAWQAPPALVVWPESALETSPEVAGAARERLRALTRELGTALLAGGSRIGWDGEWRERRFNAAFLIEARGRLHAYDKRRIVPLAEYWPWPWLPAPATFRTSWIEAGARADPFTVGGCRVGVLICFEAESPALAAGLARDGADVLVVLTNDAALSPPAAGFEIAQVRLRAAETGIPVMRVANAGPSFAALPNGDILPAGRRLQVPRSRLAAAVDVAPWLVAASAGLAALGLAYALVSGR